MALNWIPINHETPSKPEVKRIARLLGIDKDAALGKLIRFWIWVDENSRDGVVVGVIEADVDEEVNLVGFAKALIEVGWLKIDVDNESIIIPNFEERVGKTAKSRSLKTIRQAVWREGKKVEKKKNKAKSVDVSVDGDVDANVDGSVDVLKSTALIDKSRAEQSRAENEYKKEHGMAASTCGETEEPPSPPFLEVKPSLAQNAPVPPVEHTAIQVQAIIEALIPVRIAKGKTNGKPVESVDGLKADLWVAYEKDHGEVFKWKADISKFRAKNEVEIATIQANNDQKAAETEAKKKAQAEAAKLQEEFNRVSAELERQPELKDRIRQEAKALLFSAIPQFKGRFKDGDKGHEYSLQEYFVEAFKNKTKGA